MAETLLRAHLELHRQAAITEAAADAVVHLDRQARIRYANPAAIKLLGCASLDDLRGQPIVSYLQFRAASVDIRALPARGEQVCWRDDGSSLPVEYEIGPLLERGRQTGAVLTFRDISDRRAAERFKDELVGVVSHELRAPLTSIRSSLGLLASGRMAALPDSARRMLDIAVTNTDRLIRLVNDLLDLERLEKGQMPLQIERCDLAVLMREAADALQPLASSLNISVEVTPLDVELRGDPDRLVQVMLNLLSNAIKFSPIGGTVWLDAERDAGEVTVKVRDHGRGIPSDKLDSIFNRFSQVDVEDGRDNKGTGLGLAICRGIVRQHAGQIWAESTVGIGTTFFVALPCQLADIIAYPGDTSVRAA